MHSCIYEGRVRHRRFEPIAHAFGYGLYMMYLDLAELPALFRRRVLWGYERRAPAAFHRRDYLGDPLVPLEESVRGLVEARLGRRPEGPIRLLTQVRHLGYCFNPISVYYCFRECGAQFDSVVAEVTNTPWRERHSYVLDCRPQGARTGRAHRFDKALHVSPFLPLGLAYDWHMTLPGRKLAIHMDVRRAGARMFDATLSLSRREITPASLRRVVVRHPWMTARIWGAIHCQALRLWLKGCPFVPHPGRMSAPPGGGAHGESPRAALDTVCEVQAMRDEPAPTSTEEIALP